MGVLVATLLGLALRAWHLAIPLRYDEAVTFLDYASGGFVHAATHYPTPNNHILNSLLIHGATSVLGSDPWVVRLPAFLAGVLLVPATAWMAALRFGARTGVAAAFLVAAGPVLVEYSTNARGYTMVALATVVGTGLGERLLRDRRSNRSEAREAEKAGDAAGASGTAGRAPSRYGGLRAWAAFGAAMVLGTYAVPVMLLPWLGLVLWLWVNLWVGGGTLRERLRRERALLVTTAAAGAAVVALYTPVALANGLGALTGNRFVAPLGWGAFLGSVPGAVAAVGRHWARGVPGPLVAVAALGLAGALLLRPGRRHAPDAAGGRFPLGIAVVIGVAELMLVKRNAGEARIWLWALPLLLTAAAAGLVALFERVVRLDAASRVDATPRTTLRTALHAGGPAVAAAWAGLVALHLVLDRPLWRSLETGGFTEGPDVAAWLAERVQPGDAVMTDFVSWEPLRYHLGRNGVDPSEVDGPPAPGGRAWVVLNYNEEDRVARVLARTAPLRLPLGQADPMATLGSVEIYGFGQGPAPGG